MYTNGLSAGFLIPYIDHRRPKWNGTVTLLTIDIYIYTYICIYIYIYMYIYNNITCLCFKAGLWKWRDSGTSSWIDPCIHRVYLFCTYALWWHLRFGHLLAVILWTDKRVGKVRRDVLSTGLVNEKLKWTKMTLGHCKTEWISMEAKRVLREYYSFHH